MLHCIVSWKFEWYDTAMDLLLMYFNEIVCKVRYYELRYYDSQFFGRSTYEDIQKQFNNAISD